MQEPVKSQTTQSTLWPRSSLGSSRMAEKDMCLWFWNRSKLEVYLLNLDIQGSNLFKYFDHENPIGGSASSNQIIFAMQTTSSKAMFFCPGLSKLSGPQKFETFPRKPCKHCHNLKSSRPLTTRAYLSLSSDFSLEHIFSISLSASVQRDVLTLLKFGCFLKPRSFKTFKLPFAMVWISTMKPPGRTYLDILT